MKQHIDIEKTEPKIFQAMLIAEKQVAGFGLDAELLELVRIRASQLNGCAYCLDMHTKIAKKRGMDDRKLFTLSAWWETPFFSEDEQIALNLTEEVTRLNASGVSHEIISKAIAQFGEHKFLQLLFAIVTINSWNRLSIATHLMPE